jgi:alpha-galactosidase
VLLAYEHGADHPDSFFEYHAAGTEDEHGLDLVARKGNTYHGQPIGPAASWESVWFELGLAPVALPAFLRAYRTFFLEEICENTESRQPYLYYNTWNYQERNRYFRNQPYLASMHYERIDTEIDIAHRLGIDVFVIDTGWYVKTGDWEVNTERFPDGLRAIKAKLDSYGMQLGLWFNPTVAALSSEIYQTHPEYTMTRQGKSWQRPIWETEESTSMCLDSPYADYFIEKMVSLHDELGVTYFKWDAVQQYGCDSPLHNHGTEANSPEERADCYAYGMGRQMIRIVEEVTRRCPRVVVDFDITEGGRFVGLGFLSVGKYFLINNGPYFHDLDIPSTTMIDPNTINVFFYPGPARPRICRQGVKYDGVIPSILFLTHYLPDPPLLSQRNSLAALMLGGNGIWGDLLSLGEGDIELLSEHLHDYKQIGQALTRSYPRVYGFMGSSPEIYEKLDPASATGAVIFFTVTPGTITHITQPLAPDPAIVVKGADAWERLPDGRLKLRVDLAHDDARVVYVIGGP